MKSTTPTSIAGLVKHVEGILKRQPHFFVSYTHTQRDPVVLKSLKLREVRKPTEAGLHIIVDGVFVGRDGPHKFEASPDVLALCGLTALSVGMGACPSTNGTVSKGIGLRICPSYLKCGIGAEAQAMFRPVKPATRLNDLKPVKETKPYKQALQEMLELDDKIGELTQARDRAQAKLDRMCAKALEKAQASVLLPAKASSRRASAAS